MIEKIAWETFKNTGNINTMMELLQTDKIKNQEVKNQIEQAKEIEINQFSTK